MKKTILLAVFLCSCLPSKTGSIASSQLIVALTERHGPYISNDEGENWRRLGSGLPLISLPLEIHETENYYFITTFSDGLFRLKKGESFWENISHSDFKRRTSFLERGVYRKISAFASDGEHIAVATKHSVFISSNSGTTWKTVLLNGIHPRNYITALGLSGNNIAVGTSFNGFFEKQGSRFRNKNNGLPGEKYSGNLRFTEEMSLIKNLGGNLYSGFYFGGGLYSLEKKSNKWEKVNLPGINEELYSTDDITFSDTGIAVSAASSIFTKKNEKWLRQNYADKNYDLPSKPVMLLVNNSSLKTSLNVKLNKAGPQKKFDERASDIKAVYQSIPSLRKNPDDVLSGIKSAGLNALVIDMKDDFGWIRYKSALKTASDIGSVRGPVDIDSILKTARRHGLYTIARIVTFKDKALYLAYGNRYSIKRQDNRKPWKGSPGEYWVDPYSDFVQNYNLGIAKELEAKGFDEIQFDYIRFPSDGPVKNCFYSYNKDIDTYKSEILCDFLIKAKASLGIPVSVDIYGFNSWYSFGNSIGQDMQEFSLIVDAISPMVYPSHFGRNFYERYPHNIRPYHIIRDGARRAEILSYSSSVIRPYLQAFKMLSPTFGTGYITNQTKGAKEGGSNGYIFWHAAGNYKTVYKALKE